MPHNEDLHLGFLVAPKPVIRAEPMPFEARFDPKEFHKNIPAIIAIEKRLREQGVEPLGGDKDTVGRAFRFDSSVEAGEVRIYGRKYRNGTTQDGAVALRVEVVSTSRRFVTTAVLVAPADTNQYTLSFVQKDPIDPTHGVRNPETAGGCFDCPPGNFVPPAPGGTWDPTFWNCPKAKLDLVVDCVFGDSWTDCIQPIADFYAWC